MNPLIKTILFLFSLQLLFLFNSCDTKCDPCQDALTDEEKSFICYQYKSTNLLPYTVAYFKNNISNAIDSLQITQFEDYRACDTRQGCQPKSESQGTTLKNQLGSWRILVQHNFTPLLNLYSLDIPTQTLTVNNLQYSDIFSIQTNSTNTQFPTNIYYSRSQGFIAFFMRNGSIWIKQ